MLYKKNNDTFHRSADLLTFQKTDDKNMKSHG